MKFFIIFFVAIAHLACSYKVAQQPTYYTSSGYQGGVNYATKPLILPQATISKPQNCYPSTIYKIKTVIEPSYHTKTEYNEITKYATVYKTAYITSTKPKYITSTEYVTNYVTNIKYHTNTKYITDTIYKTSVQNQYITTTKILQKVIQKVVPTYLTKHQTVKVTLTKSCYQQPSYKPQSNGGSYY